jgi:gas vesicle protein
VSDEQVPTSSTSQLRTGTLLWGAVIGFVMGAIYALMNLPKSGAELWKQLSEQGQEISSQLQTEDPVEQSLAYGKDIARQRQTNENDA